MSCPSCGAGCSGCGARCSCGAGCSVCQPFFERDRTPEWERVYGSVERVRWIRESRSVASGGWPCVNAHVKPEGELPSGTGRKAGCEWIVPLTWEEHLELHQLGQRSFELKHELDLTAAARATAKKWTERRAS